MTRRLGILALGGALAVFQTGCILHPTVPNDPTAPGAVATRTNQRGEAARPLPPGWEVREPSPHDHDIDQVNYSEPRPDRLVPPAEPKEEPASVGAKPHPDRLPDVKELPSFALATRQTPEDPLEAALRCCRENRPGDAAAALKDCDSTNREALLCLLPLAVRLSQTRADQMPPTELDETLDQLQTLSLALRPRASLRLAKVSFCRVIKQFGVYTPVPQDEAIFRAGRDGRPGDLVEVYAEVRNFTSKQDGEWFVTQLASHARILDYGETGGAAPEKKGEMNFGEPPDRSRTPRQDYFINYRFSVPPNLPPGHYTLQIYVKDKLAQSSRPEAMRSLDFRVIAGVPVPGSRGEPH